MLLGQGGNDTLQGDVTGGEEGADSLEGGAGADLLYGDGNGVGTNDGYGTPNDTLIGGADNDTLQGDDGTDVYKFFTLGDTAETLGTDTIQTNDVEGFSIKTLDFSAFVPASGSTGITVNLATATSQTVVSGRLVLILSDTTISNVIGSASSDTITGNGYANTLSGGDGNDT